MPDRRRNDKPSRKDQTGPREIREEVGEEIQQDDVKPRVENPNRDRARGDWDRSGVHHDEGTSRSTED
jgi:hypothetical protein